MIRRFVFAVFATAALAGAVGTTAVANAEPGCPGNTVTIQGEVVPAPVNKPCDTDEAGGDGLLGNAPVVGNLPGLGGVL
jgi:hypothetical protein